MTTIDEAIRWIYDRNSELFKQIQPGCSRDVLQGVTKERDVLELAATALKTLLTASVKNTGHDYNRLTIRSEVDGKILCLQEYSKDDLIEQLAMLEDMISSGELIFAKELHTHEGERICVNDKLLPRYICGHCGSEVGARPECPCCGCRLIKTVYP